MFGAPRVDHVKDEADLLENDDRRAAFLPSSGLPELIRWPVCTKGEGLVTFLPQFPDPPGPSLLCLRWPLITYKSSLF